MSCAVKPAGDQPAFRRKYPRRWLCADPIRQPPPKPAYTITHDIRPIDTSWITDLYRRNKNLSQHIIQLEAKLKSNRRFIDAITAIGRLVGVPYPDPAKILVAVSARLASIPHLDTTP